MPDIGGLEFLVIAVVALIVLGPKDLTKLFRQLGQFTGRMRGMAKEFSRAMNDAAGDTGLNDVARDLRKMTDPKKMGVDAVKDAFKEIDPTKYPEGSHSRKLAEERAEKAAATQAKVDSIKAEKAAAAAAAADADAAPGQTPRPTAGEP